MILEWICYLHHQPCHVVYTDTRPVPLQHLIFPCGADGLYEVVDIKVFNKPHLDLFIKFILLGKFQTGQFSKGYEFPC